MEPADPISILADNRLNSDDFFQILESHRRSCQREGRFDEAELTRMRILELRAHEEHAKREQMVSRQQAERASLEDAHKTELEKLMELWEQEALPSFDEAIKVAVIELREKHRQELEDARWRQEKELDKERQHPPSQILNLKRRLETLAQTVKGYVGRVQGSQEDQAEAARERGRLEPQVDEETQGQMGRTGREACRTTRERAGTAAPIP